MLALRCATENRAEIIFEGDSLLREQGALIELKLRFSDAFPMNAELLLLLNDNKIERIQVKPGLYTQKFNIAARQINAWENTFSLQLENSNLNFFSDPKQQSALCVDSVSVSLHQKTL